MISAKCQCGKIYQMPDEKAGKSFRCKSCGATFLVSILPDGVEEVTEAPASSLPSPSRKMQSATATAVEAFQSEFDLATLALKGRKFKEAEERYTRLIQLSNSIPAWCGLGLAKMGLPYTQEVTVDEIVYCFEKAKQQCDEQNTEPVEILFLDNVLKIIKDFYCYYFNTFAQLQEADRQALFGAVTMGISAFSGASRDANLYKQLTAASGTAYGVYQIKQAHGLQTNATATQNYMLDTIIQLSEAAPRLADSSKEYYKQYLMGFNEVSKPYMDMKKRQAETLEIKKKKLEDAKIRVAEVEKQLEDKNLGIVERTRILTVLLQARMDLITTEAACKSAVSVAGKTTPEKGCGCVVMLVALLGFGPIGVALAASKTDSTQHPEPTIPASPAGKKE